MLRAIAIFIIVLMGSNTNTTSAIQTECPPCESEDCAEQYRQLAQDYSRDGDHATAVEILTCALDISPQDPILLLNRAFDYVELEEFALAEADARHATELDSSYEGIAEVVYAYIGYETDDLPGAISSLKRAIEVEPNQPGLVLLLGLYYVRADKYESAIDVTSIAIESDPQPVYYLLRAYAYDKLNHPQDANSDIEAALEQDPHIVEGLIEDSDENRREYHYRNAYLGLELAILVLRYKPEQLALIAP